MRLPFVFSVLAALCFSTSVDAFQCHRDIQLNSNDALPRVSSRERQSRPSSVDKLQASRRTNGDFDGYEDDKEAKTLFVAGIWSSRGEIAAKSLPSKPSPDLSVEDVITAIIRGLQFNNVRKENDGLLRCYEFMTLKCIKMVTGHGNVPEERTLDKFLGYAVGSPKLRPFMEATAIEMGRVTRIPKTLTRGEIASMPIQVESTGTKNTRKRQTFMIRLEQQRRPPLAGAYLVTDLFDVASVKSISRPLNRE
jgi:hypothetical protein